MPQDRRTIAHEWFDKVWNQGRAEAIDDQGDGDAALGGTDQRVIDAPPGRVVGVDVIQQPQRLFRSVDQVDEGLQAVLAGLEQGQAVAVDGAGRGRHARGMGQRAGRGKQQIS